MMCAFKSQISSVWWKCTSPCVIIMGTRCSHLHCARLQSSRLKSLRLWKEASGGGFILWPSLIRTHFLCDTFTTPTSNKCVSHCSQLLPSDLKTTSEQRSSDTTFSRPGMICLPQSFCSPCRAPTIQSYILISRCLLGPEAIVENSAQLFFFFFLFNGNQGWSMYNLYTCFEWFITYYFGMEPICFITCICLFIELLGRG